MYINDNLLQTCTIHFNQLRSKLIEENKHSKILLKDICNFVSGYPFKTEGYIKLGQYKIYTIKNIQKSYIVPEVDNYIDDIPADMAQKCKLNFMDILLSLTGNVGRCAQVYDNNCLLNQRVLKIEPLPDFYSWIYLSLNDKSFEKFSIRVSNGTSQKNLSPSQVGSFEIYCPNKDTLIKFNKIVYPILNMIVQNNNENLFLTRTRDFLLPLLLNEQITIK